MTEGAVLIDSNKERILCRLLFYCLSHILIFSVFFLFSEQAVHFRFFFTSFWRISIDLIFHPSFFFFATTCISSISLFLQPSHSSSFRFTIANSIFPSITSTVNPVALSLHNVSAWLGRHQGRETDLAGLQVVMMVSIKSLQAAESISPVVKLHLTQREWQ